MFTRVQFDGNLPGLNIWICLNNNNDTDLMRFSSRIYLLSSKVTKVIKPMEVEDFNQLLNTHFL